MKTTEVLIAEFGREVRRRRESLGLTLEMLAERASLTPNYIGTIETGKRDPSLSTVLAIAGGLGVPAGELLGGVPNLSPASLEAARLFDTSTPPIQNAVLAILHAIERRR